VPRAPALVPARDGISKHDDMARIFCPLELPIDSPMRSQKPAIPEMHRFCGRKPGINPPEILYISA
jgi:hypothetical protein